MLPNTPLNPKPYAEELQGFPAHLAKGRDSGFGVWGFGFGESGFLAYLAMAGGRIYKILSFQYDR